MLFWYGDCWDFSSLIPSFGQGGQPLALVPQIVSHCAAIQLAPYLPTHHELASTPFNMLVTFPALITIIEHPLFCLATDFIIHNSLVMFRWTKCTPQLNPIDNKFDPHEDLAWRQLSWLLNWMLSLILASLSLDRKILPFNCETSSTCKWNAHQLLRLAKYFRLPVPRSPDSPHD